VEAMQEPGLVSRGGKREQGKLRWPPSEKYNILKTSVLTFTNAEYRADARYDN
jgi:hypothetical protein